MRKSSSNKNRHLAEILRGLADDVKIDIKELYKSM